MSGLFEHIAAFDDGERVAARKAAAVAHKRVTDSFGTFLANAARHDDLAARLALVQDDIKQIVADVVTEYGGNAEALQKSILAGWENLERGTDGKWQKTITEELEDAPSAVGEESFPTENVSEPSSEGILAASSDSDSDDDDDDDAPFGSSKKKDDDDSDDDDSDDDSDDDKDLPPWLKGKDSRTADADRDGGGAVKREDLPKGDNSGQGGPSPKIDKGNSGDERGWNLDDVDTQMSGSPKPTVTQDADDRAKYDKKEFLDQTDATQTEQTLPTNSGDAGFDSGSVTGDHTDTWSGMDGQTNPVTSRADDPDKNPVREILAEMEAESAAVAEYERNSNE